MTDKRRYKLAPGSKKPAEKKVVEGGYNNQSRLRKAATYAHVRYKGGTVNRRLSEMETILS